MDNLVISNVLFRKTRTVATMAGVALGVVLVVLTVGIAHGFLNEQGRRNSALTAEILFGAQGTVLGFSLNPTLSMKTTLADQIRTVEGVADAVPIGQTLEGRMIDGIDYDRFTRVSDIRVVEGRPVLAPAEVMIDRVQQRQRKTRIGDEMDLLGGKARVVGIYEPESLGRIKITLASMQDFLSRQGDCSSILIKVTDPSRQDEVAARIKERFPKYSVTMTRDLPLIYAEGTPALQTFLKVVVALSIVISSLVILLTMYTTVTERTRQIGVLKSLGASRGFIAAQIEKEALLISGLGVVAGFGISALGKMLITRLTTINVEFEPAWLLYALALGMLAGLLGALYPAMRAANQDPVKALAYE